jgi:hypothetical protein
VLATGAHASVRDIAKLMGTWYQRVSQLLSALNRRTLNAGRCPPKLTVHPPA